MPKVRSSLYPTFVPDMPGSHGAARRGPLSPTRVGYKHVLDTNTCLRQTTHTNALADVFLSKCPPNLAPNPCAGVEGASGDWEQDGLPLAIPGCSYEPGSALPCENLPGEP